MTLSLRFPSVQKKNIHPKEFIRFTLFLILVNTLEFNTHKTAYPITNTFNDFLPFTSSKLSPTKRVSSDSTGLVSVEVAVVQLQVLKALAPVALLQVMEGAPPQAHLGP